MYIVTTSTETSYFSGDIFNYYKYYCKELTNGIIFEIYVALFNCMYKISSCRIVYEFILGVGQLSQKIHKISSRAAKAHVRILARTFTAIKQLLLTKKDS